MTIEEVIKKAIEGGYDVSKFLVEGDGVKIWLALDCMGDFPEIAIDPSFWQSLSTALRWSENCSESLKRIWPEGIWQREWHRFIDHLADGKSAESFFETLS
jgi:hypothetical protein